MSAQKLLAEADKLLEKGKTAEAVAKVRSAVAAEPTNQLIVTKLVDLYLNLGKVAEAAQAYVQLAERLSEAGKSQVAVAVYKKALDVIPGDYNLRNKYVMECERAGKLGEAYAGAQDLLSYLIPRKKYFEALNIFVVIYRVQARDPNFRNLWLDLLLKTQSEQKLIHFLVALFGPPGIASPEIPNGGEPTEMPQEFYLRAKELIYWFPRDPKAAYGLAWTAYRRGDIPEAYRFLRECIRRDPDYTLGYLLFSRILSENKFLNECMYVYQQAKDSLSLDHSGDPQLISQQVEGFIEKNGWLSFAVGVDPGDITPQQFLQSIRGEKQEETAEANAKNKKAGGMPFSTNASEREYEATRELDVPAEIELNLSDPGDDSIEIQNNRDVKEVRSAPVIPKAKPIDPDEPSVNFTSVIKVDPAELRATKAAPTREPDNQSEISEINKALPAARQFNPMTDAAPVSLTNVGPEKQTGTIQYNPMDAVKAAGFHKEIISTANPEAKPISPSLDAMPPPPVIPELPVEPPVFVDGERTVLFSPLEAFSAGPESQRNRVVATPEEPKEISVQMATTESEKTEFVPFSGLRDIEIPNQVDGLTMVERIELPPLTTEDQIVLQESAISQMAEPPKIEPALPQMEEPLVPVDSGTDLLQEPTRVLVSADIFQTGSESSQQKSNVEPANEPELIEDSKMVERLMQKAERYLAKQKFYLARKALHNARVLGADEGVIKSRLKEVRLAELPNSMYAAISSDGSRSTNKLSPEETAVFEYLELGEESKSLSIKGDQDARAAIDALVKSVDSKSLMDLGIGFFEMGLFDGAEKLFEKIIETEPGEAFNAYFLMGQAAMARGDYARAVSIFKKLGADHSREEKDKISIYYSLGEALEKMHQSERSKTYFQKVADIDANYRNVKEKING